VLTKKSKIFNTATAHENRIFVALLCLKTGAICSNIHKTEYSGDHETFVKIIKNAGGERVH